MLQFSSFDANPRKISKILEAKLIQGTDMEVSFKILKYRPINLQKEQVAERLQSFVPTQYLNKIDSILKQSRK